MLMGKYTAVCCHFTLMCILLNENRILLELDIAHCQRVIVSNEKLFFRKNSLDETTICSDCD